MAIQNSPDNQKVDYLWKKLGYGVAKTDIAGNIDATQEPYASPLLIRSDTMWQQSGTIPAVLPASNSSVVTVYPTTFPIQCTNDAGIPTPQLTWVTGVTNWIPPEFGSTYQVKVYIAPAGQAANVTTKGTQVFATGSGNNDEWFFDYKAGILNFNSNNTPYSGASPISFTGNAVYISGGVYSGAFGLPSSVSTGNLTFSNTTISTSWSSADIVIAPTGTGIVQMYGNTALWLPTGNTTARPTNASAGYIRFNTDTNNFEYFDGTNWDVPGAATITSATINPDGTSNTYSLGYTTTSAGIIVSINGTLQQPGNAYNVTGNSITFTETPLTTDTIEVRKISAGITSVTSLQYGPTNSVTLDGANVTIQGNVLPSANITYSLGSSTYQWKDLWVSGNTIYIGGSALTVANGMLSLGGNTISGTNNFSNINVAAYTQTMGYTNYSNVNVAAYTQTMGYTNYSNVNVAAYTQTQSYTNYSNVNLSAYLGGSFSIGTIASGAWNANTITIPYGGTGATTATGALTNLLPSGAQTGYVFTTGGSGSYYWAAPSGGGGGTVGQTINTTRQSNTATAGQTIFNLVGGVSYVPGSGQLSVYINGVRQFPTEYTETSSTVYTLNSGVGAGDIVFAEINASQSFNNYANLVYASNIGNIAAPGLTVQSAINSLENNKATLVNPVFSGLVTTPTANITSGQNSIAVNNGGALTVTGGAAISKDVWIGGNLYVANIYSQTTNIISVNDPLLYLQTSNVYPYNYDIGFYSHFIGGPANIYAHSGLVRDYTDNTWKFFSNVAEPSAGLVTFDANTIYDAVRVGNVTATNINSATGAMTLSGNLTVTGNISGNTAGYTIGYKDLPQLTTSNVILSATDGGKHYYISTAGTYYYTVPSNANVGLPIGTTVVIVNRTTGNITANTQVEVSMYLAGNTTASSRTITSYGMATLIKTETNVWMINGTGVV